MKLGKLLIDKYTDKYDKDKYIRVYENVIIAKGGDGTLLRAINMYRHLNLPFWGVNAGTIGFLMNTKEPNKKLGKDIVKFKFNLIKVKAKSKIYVQDLDDDIGWYYADEEFQAFNDIMLGGDMNSYIKFDVKEKDNIFCSFHGGGLIVSTPQGSTGINKNNNGSILPLSSNMWSLTGDKTSRKIEYVIKPRKTLVNVESRTPVTLWVDGANNIITDVEEIEFTKGDQVEVIFGDFEEFVKKRRV